MISAAGSMRAGCCSAALLLLTLGGADAARQGGELRIVSPAADTIVSGSTRIQVVIECVAQDGGGMRVVEHEREAFFGVSGVDRQEGGAGLQGGQ